MMESFSGIFPSLMRSLGLESAAQGWRAVTEWPALAGARVAKHSRAVSFRDGTLVVEVEGSAWLHELGFLRRQLVRRINQHLGSEVLRDVRFVIARGGSLR